MSEQKGTKPVEPKASRAVIEVRENGYEVYEGVYNSDCRNERYVFESFSGLVAHLRKRLPQY